MKLLFSLVIFNSFILGLFAQNESCTFSIHGKILDSETNQPVPNVTIKVQGTEKLTITNEVGEYSFDGLCSKENTLIITCFGYRDTACEHPHHHSESPTIYLTKNVLELETVIVKSKKNKETGTKTISQLTINKSEIGKNPTKSLAETIAGQTGVTMASTGTNVQIPIIHGLYGNRILVLNNGLKHGFQNWGMDHAPEIDVSSANSITIIKGASGVRFGPEALGGAVIVESNRLNLNEPLNLTLGSNFQTNGRGINTTIELAKGFEKWSYFLNGNFTKIGDRNTPDYVLTNSGKQENSFGFGTRYHQEKWDFKLYYSFVNQNLALLRSSVANSGNSFVKAINSDRPSIINPFSYSINEPNQLTQHHLAKAEIEWLYTDHAKLTFRAGRQINNREEYDVRRNVEKPIIDLSLLTSDYQLEWKHPSWFELDGLFGVQYFDQNNDNNPGTDTTPFIPNYNMNRYSAFLIESKKMGKNLFELGIRFDYEQNDVRGRETSQALFKDNYHFANFTSSVGFVRQITEHGSFRTNLGTAWRSPNMAELYSFGQHGFKNSYGLLRYYNDSNGEYKTDKVLKFSEANIRPEKGYKFINEFEWNKNKNNHTVTVYSHYIQNYIFDRPFAVLAPIRGPMPGFVVDQADAVFVGADYSWKKTWSSHVSSIFSFSYLWSKNVDKNEALINQPPISTSYSFDWKTGKMGGIESSLVRIKPSYTFTQFQAPRTISPQSLIDGSVVIDSNSEIFDFKDAPKGYFLLDISWQFNWKNFEGGISVMNVLNNRYRQYLNEMRYFADELGTNVLFNLNYKFRAKKKD